MPVEGRLLKSSPLNELPFKSRVELHTEDGVGSHDDLYAVARTSLQSLLVCRPHRHVGSWNTFTLVEATT